MRRFFGIVAVVIVASTLLAPLAWGKDFTVRRNVEGYVVDIAINRNPPIVGPNGLKVEVKDPQGKFAVNLPVTVNYYMPPMPGMPPMNYTVKAEPKGTGYQMTMNLIMTGPWNIVIRVALPNKTLRITVPIDVR